MKIAWFSAGVSSFIACYLAKDIDKIIYIDIEEQHEDSMRFVKDCEKLLGKKITIMQSGYRSVERVIKATGMITMIKYAPCTDWLKKRVRKEWEDKQPKDISITYVWGYDLGEKNRANRMTLGYPDYKHEYPLIDKHMTKQDAHGLLARLGIKRPKMYDLGYQNNNCVGCIKGKMGYWNKIRVDFPKTFVRMSKLEREIGHSIIKDVNGPIFLDELDPKRGRFEDEIQEECGMMCQLNYDT